MISGFIQGGGAAPFAPTDIANCAVWIDPSDGTTITSSGGTCSQINDKSGNSAHLTQSTSGSRPATGSRTLNSLNVLDYDGSADYMVGAWPTGLVNDSDGATFIVVFDPDTVSVSQQYLWSGFQGGGLISGSGIGFTGPSTYQFQAASGNGIAAAPSSSSLGAHSGIYRRGFGSAGTTQAIYDGNVTAGTTSTNFAVTTNGWNVGRQGFNGTLYYDGGIAEIIVYSRAITNTEINQVGNYLASKWGISWTTVV